MESTICEKDLLHPHNDLFLDPSLERSLLQDLRTAVADLNGVNPWYGLFRFVSLGGITLGLAALTWQTHQWGLFVIGAIATSISYAFWLICNHDAAHHTLTGWGWLDPALSRLISWPMLLTIGTYNQLHQLHHGRNGLDLSDPERVQWTEAEYREAPAWQRWYVRHQWMVDVFIFGSIGLVVKTLLHSAELYKHFPKLRQQMMIDAIGIVSVQAIALSLVAIYGVSLWKYLLFWVVLERGIGIILQARDHVEHYGLWHGPWQILGKQTGNYQLTQLYACRNVNTYGWVNWLMGGLPYHAVHHAFPHIASDQLPEACRRIQAVLQQQHFPPMVLSPGYIGTSLHLAKHHSLIANK